MPVKVSVTDGKISSQKPMKESVNDCKNWIRAIEIWSTNQYNGRGRLLGCLKRNIDGEMATWKASKYLEMANSIKPGHFPGVTAISSIAISPVYDFPTFPSNTTWKKQFSIKKIPASLSKDSFSRARQ